MTLCYCATTDHEHCNELEQCIGLYLQFDISQAVECARPLITQCPMMAVFVAGLAALGGQQPDSDSVSGIVELLELQPDSERHPILQRHISAVQQYFHDQRRRAVRTWLDILSEMPGDLLALKFLTTACFFIGDADTMAEACLASIDFVPSIQRHHVWAMYAFAVVEKGNAKLGEKYAVRALAQCYHSAWAIHALCHCYLEQGRIQEGMELLSGNNREWRRHSDLSCHIYWHWAIFCLYNGDVAQAISIYDEEVLPRVVQSNGFPMDTSDAVSLLVRFEMLDIDVGQRWSALNGAIHRDPPQFLAYPFTASHFLILSHRIAPEQRHQLPPVLLDREPSQILELLYSGLQAYLQNRFEAALEDLISVCSRLRCIGGSNAQRDLFIMITIQAAMRCRREHQTRRLLTNRIPISTQKRVKASTCSRLKLDTTDEPVDNTAFQYKSLR